MKKRILHNTCLIRIIALIILISAGSRILQAQDLESLSNADLYRTIAILESEGKFTEAANAYRL
ncbi:MAG TPA: hypothetical protein VJ508_13960, partial [Saprospiraceae bacterium]|nr:hypothetical protein [Saprospiraceae bacterium]